MRRTVFLAVGVVGLLVAVFLAGLLTVRRPPRLLGLKPQTGIVALRGSTPTIQVATRAGTRTLDLGWCVGLSRPLTAGQTVTAWTDSDSLGRTRVWRIEQDTRPVCRFTESTAAVGAANRRHRVIALAAAAVESWRQVQRG